MLACRTGLTLATAVAIVFALGCSRHTSAPGTTQSTSNALPDACSLLTHTEANAILHRPTSSDSARQNPTFSSECNYSTARVDPTFAEIDVGVWNHMPARYGPGGTPCGHNATSTPVHPTTAYIQARGGMIIIVIGSEVGNTQAMVQQVQRYILQKI